MIIYRVTLCGDWCGETRYNTYAFTSREMAENRINEWINSHPHFHRSASDIETIEIVPEANGVTVRQICELSRLNVDFEVNFSDHTRTDYLRNIEDFYDFPVSNIEGDELGDIYITIDINL